MAGELKIAATSAASPTTVSELFAKAIEQHQAGRMERAIELYRHLVTQHPGYAPAWNNLGVALRATDKFAAAASALRRGTAISPEDAGAWSNLGKCLAGDW